jgi:predicted TIM-barrel fold metal-dependent hydrolase
MSTTTERPEHNVTDHDYADRRHFRHSGPVIDAHAHVMQTRPTDPPGGPPPGAGPGATVEQAAVMLETAAEFGIVRTYSMCPPEDIPPLRERFGERLYFNGPISKKSAADADDTAYRLLDRYLELGVEMIKFWSAPRGRERGLFVDAPWRIEAARRARAAGIRVVMVHVADPDVWFRTVYADSAKFGTKADQYVGLRRMLEEFPDLTWIGAHMGGDSEHPDHLQALLEAYPHFYLDTSATKWQVREVSARREAIRALICRYPERFLFGTDLVTRHHLSREHYVSRYWCQRTLWESDWEGRSPIADPDYTPAADGATTPHLRGVLLPESVLRKVYCENAQRLFGTLNQTSQNPKSESRNPKQIRNPKYE